MSTDPVNDKERRILGPKGPFAVTRATGAPSDASPEPLTAEEERELRDEAGRMVLDSKRWTSVWSNWTLRRLLATLDAERTSHPPAASAAGKWITEADLLAAMRGQAHDRAFPGDLVAFSERNVADLWFRLPVAAAPPRASEPAEAGPTTEDVMGWLRRSDSRIEDIFGLWVQGKRDDRWVAEKLIGEGHLAALRASR